MATEQDRRWAGSMPDAYDQFLAPSVFRPFAVELAARAARIAPRRVLEIAAGTGVLTAELMAALPDAHVTATDLNEPMVRYGAGQVPGADWQEADAGALPFDDEQFDLVACQFGVMFFPDKPTAFAEVRRVLTGGGRLLMSTWGPVETHGFAVALMAGVERAFPADPPAFVAAVPHGYPDVGQVTADLAAGGLEVVAAETVTLTGHAASAADIAAGFCTGTPLRMAIESRGDLTAATVIVSEEMTARMGAGPVTAEMTAHLIEARPALG
jgi:SAM-dependent methyltransferase